jgi:hypothetical protein
MTKKLDCTLYEWGKDPIVVGHLYRFPELVRVSSIPKSCDLLFKSRGYIRDFAKGRLVQFDKDNGVITFVGHKIQNPGSVNNKKRYLFKLHLEQEKEK